MSCSESKVASIIVTQFPGFVPAGGTPLNAKPSRTKARQSLRLFIRMRLLTLIRNKEPTMSEDTFIFFYRLQKLDSAISCGISLASFYKSSWSMTWTKSYAPRAMSALTSAPPNATDSASGPLNAITATKAQLAPARRPLCAFWS